MPGKMVLYTKGKCKRCLRSFPIPKRTYRWRLLHRSASPCVACFEARYVLRQTHLRIACCPHNTNYPVLGGGNISRGRHCVRFCAGNLNGMYVLHLVGTCWPALWMRVSCKCCIPCCEVVRKLWVANNETPTVKFWKHQQPRLAHDAALHRCPPLHLHLHPG